MTSGYFEDFEVGDSRKAGPYLVSKAEIIQFAKQYDPRPSHIDEEAATRSVFGGLSASAAHTFAIFIFLTNKGQPPLRALAGLGYDELRLPNAVRPGDELDYESTVLEKRESKSRPDMGILRIGGEQDEAIHSPLILGRNDQIRIEAPSASSAFRGPACSMSPTRQRSRS